MKQTNQSQEYNRLYEKYNKMSNEELSEIIKPENGYTEVAVQVASDILQSDRSEYLSTMDNKNGTDNETYDTRGFSSSNLIGSILQFLGVIILIIGTIGSFVLANENQNGFMFSQFIIYEFASVLSGFTIIGLAQIILLLHKINNKLK